MKPSGNEFCRKFGVTGEFSERCRCAWNCRETVPVLNPPCKVATNKFTWIGKGASAFIELLRYSLVAVHLALDSVAVALTVEIEGLMHSIVFVVFEVDSVEFAVAVFGCPEKIATAVKSTNRIRIRRLNLITTAMKMNQNRMNYLILSGCRIKRLIANILI